MVIKYIPAALLIFQGDSQIRNSYVVLFHISEVLNCTVFSLAILQIFFDITGILFINFIINALVVF